MVVDLERDADADATLAGIAERGGHSSFLKGDIAALDGHAALVDAAFDAFGRLDCLLNNAGVSVLSRGDLLDLEVESWDRCLATNLRGTFFLTQTVARRMLKVTPAEGAPQRSIITITSVNAELASTSRGEYCISKAGASMLTRLFALRLAAHDIAVYEVRPGVIRTAMTAPVFDRYQEAIDGGLCPIARWGEPEDIGRTVATLATGGLPFNVGQAVYVDGGLSLKTL